MAQEQYGMVRKLFSILILFSLLFINFASGIFFIDTYVYKNVQLNSERQVFGQIERKKRGIQGKFGLGTFYSNYTDRLGIPYEEPSDAEWEKNFHRIKNIVRIPANQYTEKVYNAGNSIKFSNGDIFKIIKVTEGQEYLQVFLDETKKLSADVHQPISSAIVLGADAKRLPSFTFWFYPSQFGLHGKVFNHLLKNFQPGEYVPLARYICLVLTSAVLLALSLCICRKFNYLLGATFYFVFLLSPWIAGYARNVYFVEFTWFLPVLAGLFCTLVQKRLFLIIGVFFLFFTFFIKCLCGYEFITTIMLTAVSFIVFDLYTAIREKDRPQISRNIKLLIAASLALLAGFIAALCLHASMRGDGDLLSGLATIYRADVMRRLYGDPALFPTVYTASLSAGPLTVLGKYLHFKSEIISGIGPEFFTVLLTLPPLIFLYNYKHKKAYAASLCLYVVFFLCSISWFVVAKSHSYIHLHTNFVLWYFGFIQICIYIILKNFSSVAAMLEPILSFFFKGFGQKN